MTDLTESLLKDNDLREHWEKNSHKRELAMAVRRLRAAVNLSQAELAERSGLSQPHISKIESPTGPLPSNETLAKYAAGCGAHVRVEFVLDVSEKDERKRAMDTFAQSLELKDKLPQTTVAKQKSLVEIYAPKTNLSKTELGLTKKARRKGTIKSFTDATKDADSPSSIFSFGAWIS